MFSPRSWIGEFMYKGGGRRANTSPPRKRGDRYAALTIERLEDRLAPATLNFLGVSDNWNNPANWSGGAVPSLLDDVVFNNAADLNVTNLNVNDTGVNVHGITLNAGFTLTIAGDLTVDTFQFNGGTINGAGSLYIAETLTWSGGIMSGAGITSTLSGATANVLLTATSGSGGLPGMPPAGIFTLTDARTFVNLGTTTWNGPFYVSSGAAFDNRGTITYVGTDFTWDSTVRLQNTGTVAFDHADVHFYGPLTLNNTINFLNGQQDKKVIINGNVTIQNVTLQEDLHGTGTLTVPGTFAWDSGRLVGTGSIVVPAGGTFDMPTIAGARKLDGRTLSVQGQRTWVVEGVTGTLPPGARLSSAAGNPLMPAYASITAWSDAMWSSPDLPMNNKVRPPAAPPPAPFNPVSAAGIVYRAMFGGAAGIGTDEDQMFRAMEGIRSQADSIAFASAYVQMYPGRNLYNDLNSELSGDDWLRAQSLYNYDWDRYVAVTMHQAMFAWSLTTDVDLMVRLALDSRSIGPVIVYKYSLEYRDPNSFAPGDINVDMASKLAQVDRIRVVAALDENTARADAAALHHRFHPTGIEVNDPEAVFSLLRSRTPTQIAQIRQEYNTINLTPTFDADLRAYLERNQLATTTSNWPYAQALMNGDRIAAAVARLHMAVDGVGTDEEMFWTALTGLYADERAMVAQVYRTTYNKTLLKEIDDEFEDSSVFGKEHERSVKL
ncbi:MAG: hypothetical protein HYX68_04090, partial [Planctomycetes bacterium]|nr:hypothetical protein [Planctomycetota bacterium]